MVPFFIYKLIASTFLYALSTSKDVLSTGEDAWSMV